MTNNFAKNLKILRKLANQNQAEVAEVVGKGHTTIGNWESGSNEPNIDELILLGKHFKVTLNELILADMSPEKENKVEDPGQQYGLHCVRCDMKDMVITAMKGQVAALEKVVTHTEARLLAVEKPKRTSSK